MRGVAAISSQPLHFIVSFVPTVLFLKVVHYYPSVMTKCPTMKATEKNTGRSNTHLEELVCEICLDQPIKQGNVEEFIC